MITVTSEAVVKIKEAVEAEGKSDVHLRIYVEGGGCSGLQYGLIFEDEQKEGDTAVDCEGINIVVDRFSLPYLEEITIDYVTTLQGAGFKINNPKATGTCGCGSSFSV